MKCIPRKCTFEAWEVGDPNTPDWIVGQAPFSNDDTGSTCHVLTFFGSMICKYGDILVNELALGVRPYPKDKFLEMFEVIKMDDPVSKLKPCPWQKKGEKCSLDIRVEDDEGNDHGGLGCDYEVDAYSGGPWYVIFHKGNCGCGCGEDGEYRFGAFESIDELIERWNARCN